MHDSLRRYSSGGLVAHWLPALLATTTILASLALFFALEEKQDQQIVQTVRAGAEGARNQMTVRMDSRFRSLVRLAKDWELSGVPAHADWEINAADYVHDLPDVEAIEWIDATHRIRWMVPMAGGVIKPGTAANLTDSTIDDPLRKEALSRAETEQRPVVTHIIHLSDGNLGFVVYVPILVDGQSDGLLAAVFNADSCMQRYLPPPVAEGEAISMSEAGQVFFRRDAAAPPRRGNWIVEERVELHGASWTLRMWPTPDLAARLNSPLPAVVLCAGLLGGLLLGAVTYYAQRSSRQAAETQRANAALRAALDQVKTLEGLLPICSYCKRVRDDTGYWSQIDTYLRKHTRASLSHSYCPECAAKFYEECGLDVPDKVKADIAAGNYE